MTINPGQYAETHHNQTTQVTTETHVTKTLELSTGAIVQHSRSTTEVETFTTRTPKRVDELDLFLELLNGLIQER